MTRVTRALFCTSLLHEIFCCTCLLCSFMSSMSMAANFLARTNARALLPCATAMCKNLLRKCIRVIILLHYAILQHLNTVSHSQSVLDVSLFHLSASPRMFEMHHYFKTEQADELNQVLYIGRHLQHSGRTGIGKHSTVMTSRSSIKRINEMKYENVLTCLRRHL